MTPDRDPPEPPENDSLLPLGAAFAGTLVLGQVVGAESPSELLLLLAVVAATALGFERLAFNARVRSRRHSR